MADTYILTAADIPEDDEWNWGPSDDSDDDGPFADEWVLYDHHGIPIAVHRDHAGVDAEAALRAMVSESKIYADWTDIEPDGDNRWKVTWDPK